MIYTTFEDWEKNKTETTCTGYKQITYTDDSSQVFIYEGELSYALLSISSFIYNNFILLSDLTDETYYYSKLIQDPRGLDVIYKFPKSIVQTTIMQTYYTKSVDGDKVSTYYDERLKIKSQSVESILFVNTIRNDYINLLYYKSDNYILDGNIIDNDSQAVGVFIPYINCILLSNSTHNLQNDDIIRYQYDFSLISFQYDCKLLPGQYTRTNNITAYQKTEVASTDYTLAHGTQFYEQIHSPYISTIGLYNEFDELLAIGKLSQPIKKSNIVQQSVIIQLEYIP